MYAPSTDSYKPYGSGISVGPSPYGPSAEPAARVTAAAASAASTAAPSENAYGYAPPAPVPAPAASMGGGYGSSLAGIGSHPRDMTSSNAWARGSNQNSGEFLRGGAVCTSSQECLCRRQHDHGPPYDQVSVLQRHHYNLPVTALVSQSAGSTWRPKFHRTRVKQPWRSSGYFSSIACDLTIDTRPTYSRSQSSSGSCNKPANLHLLLDYAA